MRIGPVASGIAGVLALGTALWVYRLRNRAGRIDALCNLREFVVEEVLREDPITFLGRFPWQKPGERAVVKVNPTALEIADAPALLPHLAMQPSSYSGAEYCFFDAVPQLLGLLSQPPLRRGYKIEVIAPASERQIARCRPPGALVMIEETPEMYDAVVRASYESLRTAKVLGWLYNVLDRKKETERLLFHDEDPALGFILNVDTKWTSHPNLTATDRADWHHHKSVQWLYCLGICNRRDIPSLRDLTGDHLPLLRAMLSRGQEAIHKVYGLPANKLRVFVHYPPQFSHFHIHFTSLYVEGGVQVERAHLLSDVIRNLEADPSYYRKCTLTYKLPEDDPLAQRLTAPLPTAPGP